MRTITPEHLYLTRRELLIGAAGALACAGPPRDQVAATIPRGAPPYPFPRNARYAVDRPVSDEIVAASYNNFYEFTSSKDVWKLAAKLPVDPWRVEVTGLVARPRSWSLDELLRAMPHEERVYRHRCVEAWSMVVPWSGFPLARLLAAAEPAHAARCVRFVSFHDPETHDAVRARPWDPWPYVEGLRLDEAMHELTFAATGIYGHALPKQHGAPVRIVVPWKYGYKSPKSVVRIELVAERPRTFWETLSPVEYPFESNVDPSTPHPRWSQATERLIGTPDVRRTLPYNGYGGLVRSLYL
ncbi:MAG TPA: protein-methionine-sulfoxide reductase catalytic subunit MsrP [Thermoanaerobaculia bacterium]|nr:protein-methionine-sulfoxide reductase catalytic subunit MsrP [Thermoanaerobaculia bacterium]